MNEHIWRRFERVELLNLPLRNILRLRSSYIDEHLPSDVKLSIVCLAYLFKKKIRNFSSIGVARKVKLNLHKFTLSVKEMEASK